MKKSRLIKELSIGVASLALVAPLVLGGMQSTPVHADESMVQALASMKEADDNTSASTKAQDKKIVDNLEKTEDRNEIHLVRTDPGEAYIDAQDLATLSPAVRRVVKIVYPRDVKKDLVPQLNGHYLHRRHHAKKHGRRNTRAKKHVVRKHRARKHTVLKHRSRKNKYGDDNMSQTARDLLSVNKHDKQYQKSEHAESANYNRGVIEDMKSDPSTVYSVIYDAFNEHEHVNHNVLRHAEYWEHRDKANGSWYSPNGEPDKRYAWGHHLKRSHRNHARKHNVRKHTRGNRKSHKRVHSRK